MEKDGLIKRKVYPHEKPVKIALHPILEIMVAYSMKYCSKDVFKDAKLRQFEQVYSSDIAEVQDGKLFS
jgi:hypothetical protein